MQRPLSTKQSIIVVGAGISGLSAAWLLAQHHDVTLVEREAQLGGHAHTVDVATAQGSVAVDTGFIVYNTATYPNLIALFEHLGVATRPAPMSFAVSLDAGRYEYSGSGLAGLMGQRSNLVSPAHWRMTRDILRFNGEASRLAATPACDTATPAGGESLGAWLTARHYSRPFIERYILPMAAAIWSTPADAMLAFPAEAFFRFFANHGLLTVTPEPTWRTVIGGSVAYVERMRSAFKGQIITGDGAVRVERGDEWASVRLASGRIVRADQVVLACHGDQALGLLADADGREHALLSQFRYSRNEAILHTDARQMPRRKRLWSSWNYVGRNDGALTVTYWMNALQSLPCAENFFVTLNPAEIVPPQHVRQRLTWRHPIFDAAAMSAQRGLWQLQGHRRTWFCGSYFGYGFHEDGLQAGLATAEAIGGVQRPWTVAGQSDRVLCGVTPVARLTPGQPVAAT